MAFLFKVDGSLVLPNPETLMIYPFFEIWERDTDEKKRLALREFAYIEFMSSQLKSNPYVGYAEDRKSVVVSKDVFRGDVWEPDKLIQEAIDKINEMQTEGSITYRYLLSAEAAGESMIDFFNNVDLSDINPKTQNPIYKPKDITGALSDTEKVLNNLKALRKKVQEEVMDASKTKANKDISFFSTAESFKKHG